MSLKETTPMMKQYLSIKAQYEDAILFYRMGDFYEMFFDDAETASPVLDLALTSRNKNDKNPVPMCGLPVRAVQGYIARLIDKGYKVAICEQVEDPSKAKGLVKREVVRVVTPGMLIEDELLDEKSNNFIISLYKNQNGAGLALLDISTGTFKATESENITAIIDEARRITPKEILLPESLKDDPSFRPLARLVSQHSFCHLDDRIFQFKTAYDKLISLFGTINLEGFGCEKLKNCVCAAGAIIDYVARTQKQNIEHISRIEPYMLDRFLLVDNLSCRNLELIENIRNLGKQGTLLDVMDQTVTAMGARLFKEWIRYPLIDEKKIVQRLDAVEEAKENIRTSHSLREHLKSVYDLERIGARIAMGRCNPKDILSLKQSLAVLPEIGSILSSMKSALFIWDQDLKQLQQLKELIESSIRNDAPLTINEGGIIRDGYNQELDELIKIGADGRGWLTDLEAKQKDATGIHTLKVKYNKVFGYYLEVPKGRIAEVPSHYIRKQTLVNAERYITDELKSFESKVLNARERRTSLESELFDGIRKQAAEKNNQIQAAARFIARLDCLLSLCEVADQNDYTRPELNSKDQIIIEDGRHPVIEKMIKKERFVPNSISMDNSKNQILIITGPNMAGKSTVLRQVAILTLMAHMGSFIPASYASICKTDRIFTRVGALDNLAQGQSTFMVEMQETANILNNTTPQSLIIMDEIGRGTSTYDGFSIAWAVAEYLHDLQGKGSKTLFATHYHELTKLADFKHRVKNYNIAVKEFNDEVLFLRKLVAGSTNKSYGIHVARLAGIPDKVVKKAKNVLADIEENTFDFNKLSINSQQGTLKTSGQSPIQLDLFGGHDTFLIDELKNLDITSMTPIDAINRLSELQEKARLVNAS
ncbi:DNA mismatch repair protein MutS [Desulfobacterales bacterium HSG16]|nr:DNA mismatch repair protein MutS [Desulfobacterales bacterium HSG16]